MHKIPEHLKPRCTDCKKIIHNCRKIKSPRCRKCWALFIKGHPENHPFWKGGKTHSLGYVWRYARGHPYANNTYRVAEHRLVMEQKLGRFLKPNEHVHHIDGSRDNNQPDNLALTSGLEHIGKYHSKKGCLMCDRTEHYARGYCHAHYERWRLIGFKGSVPPKDKTK